MGEGLAYWDGVKHRGESIVFWHKRKGLVVWVEGSYRMRGWL